MNPHAISVLGTGAYVPEREVTNAEIEMLTGATPEWVERKTGILTRRYAAAEQATSDLATSAAQLALESANTPADRIDFLIVATSTGDHPQPPTAHLVQHAIGAENAACLDINVVCSGFVYALALAHSLLLARPGQHALVVGADLYSRSLDYSDKRISVLLGDGAGAAVVGPARGAGDVVEIGLAARGEGHRLIRVEAGGSRRPATAKTVADGDHFVRMEGRAVRDFVLEHVPPALTRLAERANVGLDQIDHFVPHQPNGVLIDDLVKAVGVGGASTHRTVERHGNMGSASIPVTLDQANKSGALNDGDLVLLAGFGGGMAVGSCLLRWEA